MGLFKILKRRKKKSGTDTIANKNVIPNNIEPIITINPKRPKCSLSAQAVSQEVKHPGTPTTACTDIEKDGSYLSTSASPSLSEGSLCYTNTGSNNEIPISNVEIGSKDENSMKVVSVSDGFEGINYTETAGAMSLSQDSVGIIDTMSANNSALAQTLFTSCDGESSQSSLSTIDSETSMQVLFRVMTKCGKANDSVDQQFLKSRNLLDDESTLLSIDGHSHSTLTKQSREISQQTDLDKRKNPANRRSEVESTPSPQVNNLKSQQQMQNSKAMNVFSFIDCLCKPH